MKNFVHIGMPKTLSSALQSNFFPTHQEIYFLGVGCGSLIDYIDDEINFTLESLLLYARENYYVKHKVSSCERIQNHKLKALSLSKKAFGASSEWLSFNFTPDMIDFNIKSTRLKDLFGDDLQIIVILREQMSLLQSLWGEYIKVGMAMDYRQFINYVWNFKERNFYYDLDYYAKYETLLRHFKKENIHFIPLEHYRNKNGNLKDANNKILLIEKLCDILEIEYPNNFEMPQINPSLNNKELYHKLALNRKHPHDFGNGIFEHANIHRSREYLKREKSAGIADYFEDVKIKRFSLESAKKLAQLEDSTISYECNSHIMENLKTSFVESNERLSKISNINLPKEYLCSK